MTIDEIVNSEEFEYQQDYVLCVELLDKFQTKTQDELLLEIVNVWKTWLDGDGKREFCERIKIDYGRMHNLVSGATRINFEDYIRIMSVGKDYLVIEQKYPMTDEIRKAVNRVKYKRAKGGE